MVKLHLSIDETLEPNLQPKSEENKSKIALFGFALTGGLAVGLSIITASFLSPALRRFCLPYVPATEKQIKNVLMSCQKKQPNNLLVDLGSGDGRIVFAAAKLGYNAIGYELNPWLVLYSKVLARFYGLNKRARFQRQDLWKADIGKYDNIVIFGVAEMMNELSVKLETEMKDTALVVACRFEIQQCESVNEIQDGIDSVWVYDKQSFLRRRNILCKH